MHIQSRLYPEQITATNEQLLILKIIKIFSFVKIVIL